MRILAFLYAKVHDPVGIGPIPKPPVVYDDDVEFPIQELDDRINWGDRLKDLDDEDDYDEDNDEYEDDYEEDYEENHSDNKDNFSLFSGRNCSLTIPGGSMTALFVLFNILLRFIDPILRVYITFCSLSKTLGFPFVFYKEKDQKTLQELKKELDENKRELEVEKEIQKDLPSDHPDKSSRGVKEWETEIDKTGGEIVGKIADWLNSLFISFIIPNPIVCRSNFLDYVLEENGKHLDGSLVWIKDESASRKRSRSEGDLESSEAKKLKPSEEEVKSNNNNDKPDDKDLSGLDEKKALEEALDEQEREQKYRKTLDDLNSKAADKNKTSEEEALASGVEKMDESIEKSASFINTTIEWITNLF